MNIVSYKVIGLMSGTSLDGLDIAFCEFEKKEQRWSYQILNAETVPYDHSWKDRLANVEKGSARDLAITDIEYGHYIGLLTKTFIDRLYIQPHFIASHGHTVFHQPEKHITWQIGKGSSIAAETGLPVVCDFRSLDVALGGQGAPLVPIGDRILFSDFDYCLNLGGFANISFEKKGQRIAFDICPVNIVLNHIASKIGMPYDPSGQIAATGTLNPTLLATLDDLPYYNQTPPKSLGKEWVMANITPIFSRCDLPINDQLKTFCEHIALQIAKVTGGNGKKILVTGGGAFNDYLMERIRHRSRSEVILPDKDTINFKEALIFAFLGVLRWCNETNCLRSVTGAEIDNSGGAIYQV